jgi:hypothetical protein
MVKAEQGTSDDHKQAYNRFAFIIGLAIARGLVFCFFGTLAPFKTNPPRPREGGCDLDKAWEKRTFGGDVWNRADQTSDLGLEQAGTLWLVVGFNARQIVLPGSLATHPPLSKFPDRSSDHGRTDCQVC